MDAIVLCHRCGVTLTSGAGSFYVVRIEAVADPTPPEITAEDLQMDLDAEYARLLDELRDASEQGLRDQIYRNVTIHLCGPCYREWIEDPTK